MIASDTPRCPEGEGDTMRVKTSATSSAEESARPRGLRTPRMRKRFLIAAAVFLVGAVVAAGCVATLGAVTQVCNATNPGAVDATLNWAPVPSGNDGQWVDLSLHSTFPAGAFTGWGPWPSSTNSITWQGLAANTVYHWRVNTLKGGAWLASSIGTFTTIPCGQSSELAPPTGMRMAIPRIGVNAPLNVRVVGPDGVMENPNGRFDVIWYDFSNRRGLGGFPGVPGANSLFSGHVDYHPNYTAVFWDLRQLVPGDIIDVYLLDGSLVRYAVEWTRWIDPSIDFASYTAQTGEEIITIVTCTGTFNPATGDYSNRFVVRGKRIY